MNIATVNYPAPTSPFTPRSAGAITDFIVHHSAGPKSQTPMQIDAFERTEGDIYIPYTWLIDDKGTIYSGRPPEFISAASYGRNAESVAVCLIGNFQKDDKGYNGPPSTAALNSLYDLCLYAHKKYPSIIRTYPHGSIAHLFFEDDDNYATECAGDQLNALVPGIKSRISKLLVKK